MTKNFKELWLKRFRLVSEKDVFDIVEVDDLKLYNLKNSFLETDKWYYEDTLEKLYKYNSINLHMKFKSSDIPKRCEKKVKNLSEVFYTYLKTKLKRVSKPKCRLIVAHLVKHVSRLVYHKKFTITYTRKRDNWSSNKTLSHEYMLYLVDYLTEEGFVYNFLGSKKSSGENVLSMLIISPSFIKDCINYEECPKIMEECLRRFQDPSVVIRDKDKNTINVKGEELDMVNHLTIINDKYNEQIASTVIYINGRPVPELFFRRIGAGSVRKGMRNYDDGSVQGQDAVSRETVTIDGEDTIEIDYASLHYCLAAEQEGIKLPEDSDPYDFDVDIEVDWDAVKKWKEDTGWDKTYNPVRNLKKSAMLIMFNASDKESAKKAIRDAIFKDGKKTEHIKKKFVGISKIPANELINRLIEKNKIVSKYFLSGVGLDFQRKDSDMMMYCIERFLEIGEVCIPIHDSLIVKKSLKGFGIKCMQDAYKHVMGSTLNCKIK